MLLSRMMRRSPRPHRAPPRCVCCHRADWRNSRGRASLEFARAGLERTSSLQGYDKMSRLDLGRKPEDQPGGYGELTHDSGVVASAATMVCVKSVVIDGSPRSAPVNPDHVRLLAESMDALPPVIVHRPSMRVIDGVHRVEAALLSGRDEIAAQLINCDDNQAFLLAVKANTTHGLPLSRAERTAAAVRIILQNAQWSDRAVAATVGLSAKTISRIRACSTAEGQQLNTRLGQDGRVRPLDVGSRRREAVQLLRQRPGVGLREVAQATGLSAATVRDVRLRMDRGEDPVPLWFREHASSDDATKDARIRPSLSTSNVVRASTSEPPQDPAALLQQLQHDPALRFTDGGRFVLRWLHGHTANGEGFETVGRMLPDHCAPITARLARSCAAAWLRFAEQLEQRMG